ncbi:MAG: plasmid mobilization relaxosome protein MobC [Bacteroidota bacterium]
MNKNKQQRYTEFVQARLTPNQKTEFLRRCQTAGLSTGDYIRVACVEAKPLRATRNVSVDQKLIILAIGQLKRYGNVLNQIARRLNQGHRATRRDIQEIRKALKTIRQVCLLLRQALGFDTQR